MIITFDIQYSGHYEFGLIGVKVSPPIHELRCSVVVINKDKALAENVHVKETIYET